MKSDAVTGFRQAFSAVKVLIVGDVMLDRYWFGSVDRISPEAPVPVLSVNNSEERAGGAANVAANVAALGAKCTLLSVTGKDSAGDTLAGILDQLGIDSLLHRDDNAQTTVKLRVLSRNQQLLRLDFETPPAHEVLASCLSDFREQVTDTDIVIISDYGKGGLFHIREMITAAQAAGKPIIVDPKGADFSRYENASIITPNLKELESVAGAVMNERDLKTKAENLVRSLKIEGLLVTRSEHGMSIHFGDGSSIHQDATSKDVYDVSGAGDTVIGAVAVAVAAGLSYEQTLQLANAAAGIVVGKLGTAVASFDEVIAQSDFCQ